MAVKKKPVIKNINLLKVVETAIDNLNTATTNGLKALSLATKKSKQSSAEGKRLNKKRVTLIKRHKSAALKVKKDPIAVNKNGLKVVAKELAAIRKEVAKNKIVKAANFDELSGLRVNCRRLAMYTKAIAAADRALNKPKKKNKSKKRKTS